MRKSRIISDEGQPTPPVFEVDKDDVGSITYSRLSTFLNCSMKEHYSYRIEGRGIELVQEPIPFIEGSFLHYALEHFHGKGQQMLRANLEKKITAIIEDKMPMDPETHDKLTVKLAAMMGSCFGYKSQYAGDKNKYKTLFVEAPFKFEFEGFVFEGKLDWITEDMESGAIMFWDHKSTSSSTGQLVSKYSQLPLDLQGLIYTLGAESILGKIPDYKAWNFIVKSKLRRKGKIEKANLETLTSYQARVQNEYVEAPEKMFFRPPPLKINEKHTDYLKQELSKILKRWNDEPCMEFQCLGKFDLPCAFVDACRERMNGVGQGWDSGKNKGLYKIKETQHTEL